MKKTLLSIVVISAALFIACSKKDRTCECTVTKTGTSTTTGKVSAAILPGFPSVDLADTSFVSQVNEISTSEATVMQKVTKKTAKNNCFSYNEPYHDKTVTSVPASSFNLSVVVDDVGTKQHDCKLK
jgi:hypothetical protein